MSIRRAAPGRSPSGPANSQRPSWGCPSKPGTSKATRLIHRHSVRRIVSADWFIPFAMCLLLLKLHITSGLGLGLTC
ncbi:DUF5993 family protein [Nocardia fluminea]|uniref:DUF5993 family protein n=1 Tax=Nocardia fluminea TaxID=134984 RepID=UPI0033C7E7D2